MFPGAKAMNVFVRPDLVLKKAFQYQMKKKKNLHLLETKIALSGK